MADDNAAPARATRGARLVGFAVLGAFGLYALSVALSLGLWRGRSPGEGLFPFITAAGMLAFSAGGIAITLKAPREADAPEEGERDNIWRMVFYLAALLFYALTLEPLGFVAATIVSITAILRFAERYSWITSLAIAAGAAVACHVLFAKWLGAILPAGTLWDRFTG
jgi:hypothetical protein